MIRTGPPPHLLRKNHVTRVPRTFVYLDSEASQTVDGAKRVQRFRLAVAAVDRRYHHRPDWAPRVTERFTDTAILWKWIDAQTKVKSRTVVVAHNLAYDLRITNALNELPKLGYTMKSIRLDGGHAWATFAREHRTLMLCDSLSWVPQSLDKLGEMIDVRKLGLPAWDDSDEAWFARCERDVQILGDVWRRLMTWVEIADLGNWRPTGAGQSWSAYRHRFMHDALLVHDDPVARAAERRSTYTGRCEAWKHGKVSGGPFSEWDFTTAYAIVGRECSVPIRLLRCHHDVDLAGWHVLRRQYAVLSDVVITTDTPTAPTVDDDRVCWPVGRFRSTLWEHEIALAIDRGARVEVERCWTYERAPALRDFCAWVLDQLTDQSGAVDPIVRAALKHWSRSLIGRFGARWPRWGAWGTSTVDDIALSSVLDGDTGERWRMLQLGRKLWRESEPADAPDCLPSIMSWIMGECRVRLWRACETAGLDEVAYVDTDALWTTAAGTRALRASPVAGLRVKAEARTLHVLGPRQIVANGTVRAAGVARGAVMLSDGTFQSEAWRQLDTSLRHRETDTVVIAMRNQRLHGTDRRRDHLAGGLTAPIRVTL